MKVVYPIESRCINCHLCEVACIVEHSRSKNPLGAYHLENLRFNPQLSADFVDPAEAADAGRPRPLNRCVVEFYGPQGVSLNCRHCEHPDCVYACKNGSLHIADDGRVLVDEDKCVGCWMCVMACRYGAVGRNVTRRNVPLPTAGVNLHCDLCPQRQVPACVAICPTRALVFEDRSEDQQPSSQAESIVAEAR